MTTLTASSQLTDGCDVAMANAIDRLIRISTAVAVLAVASVAAYVSYWHAYAVVRTHGESGLTARLEPATIDGLVYASSMVILYAARHGSPVPRLARCPPGDSGRLGLSRGNDNRNLGVITCRLTAVGRPPL
jgi:Protein of unknown function (DUF2637)